jgi:hypothetical protein
MTAETANGQAADAAARLTRFRAEHAAQQDRSLQAILLHECGVLAESLSEEPAAARDYLAAFNADPQFREPLEALVRILTRRKSLKNLGKLLEALTRAASTPVERSRAFCERAAFLQDYEQNPAGAKEALEEAVGCDPEDPAPWAELELLAAKEGDVAGRMRAIEARAELASDPTWKALLFIDLAGLAAQANEFPRAYDLLDTAAALEGRARFRTQLALLAAAVKEDNLDVQARALEGQASLIEEAIDDSARGDAIGVPRYLRTPAVAADAWLRAAELKRRGGDAASWSALLQRASDRLPESSIVTRARLQALEAAGDSATVAELAHRELARVPAGAGAASLWLRLAEAAALANDPQGYLSALQNALAADPECIPARALEIDLLSSGQDAAALARAFEASAEACPTQQAKGRAFLMAAHVLGCRGGDIAAAKAALARAEGTGIDKAVTLRLARSLAAIRGDSTWYEQATEQLVAAPADAAEASSLLFELGRSRLLRGDAAGAREVFARLATHDAPEDGAGTSAWLGRVLAAYAVAPGQEDKPDSVPSADLLEALAKVESDPAIARGLWVAAALRSARAGQAEPARARLRELAESSPADEVVSILLAELHRSAGDNAAAAATLVASAAATDDPDLAAALHMEAALILWRTGNRARAVELLELARSSAPKAAAPLLTWALRGADADSLEGRRRALESAAEAGDTPVILALERFGLEVGWSNDGGSADEALQALESLEAEGKGDIELAAALARLLWSPALGNREAVEFALARLEERGAEAKAIACAERFRLARMDEDRAQALSAAAAWVEADPTLATTLEWLGAAIAAEDREAEVSARRTLATHFDGDAQSALDASAAIVAMLDQAHAPQPLIGGDHVAAQLVNLELALPGCDPRRRASALRGLGDALGDEAKLDALALAAWSDLAAGAYDDALATFRSIVEVRPEDIASWEGVRAASEALGDNVSMALAAAQLGARCRDNARGAEFWEMAGMILLEKTAAHDDAEIAFDRAFERNPRRGVAFDKLFRRVRARNEDDKLLDIIGKRLQVAEEEQEIGKLFWERARVLRKQGDRDGALAALENVTMLEPDHVGALALAGEIQITKGAFDEAAPLLARLATIKEAPQQQRLMSGIAAVDLYEKRLNEPDKALEVLVGLHRAGLSTPPVRERLAMVAARIGSWTAATGILEQLMNERETREGRIEAARLAMAIYRDKIREPLRAQAAVVKLLGEAPDDGEAIDLVLTTSFDQGLRKSILGRAKITLVQTLAANPTDADRVALLAKIANAGGDAPLRQATLGALVALGRNDEGISDELRKLDARVAARPQIVLDAQAMAEIADPQDTGPVADLFALMAETICLSLGPSLVSMGVTKKDRVEGRGGHPLRVAVAEWMGALGFEGDFDLYVGGHQPRVIEGISGETPAIVLGSAITTPLDTAARSAIARSVFALRRGITTVRTRDDNTIASIVVAACNEAGLSVPAPAYAVFGEVSRSIHKEIPRKIKKMILEPCEKIMATKQDARVWAAAARRSIDRMAVIAAGDVSIVLSDILGVPREQLGSVSADHERARRLLAFVLSPSYLELRKKLGMGVR